MSREEAIARLKVLTDYEYDEDLEALEIAIKALEQKPCEDAISREAVLEKAVYTETEEGWSGRTVDVKDIEALPSVTPKEKIGKWKVYRVVDFGDFKGTEKYKCSECGEKVGVFKSNFCPNCGARMVESQKSEEKE